jgi:hypothetical protein
VPPSVWPAGAQGGTLACSTGAALSFVSCIRLLGRFFNPPGAVERFRSDVSPIGPADGSSLQEETLEVRRVLQRFEDRTYHPGGEVHRLLATIMKHKVEAMAATVLGTHNVGKNAHDLLQWLDSFECSAKLHVGPVRLKLSAVLDGPLPNQSLRYARPQVTSQQLSGKVERGLLALLLRVEMRRPMLLVEHANHDPEERADDRHTLGVYAVSLPLAHVGLTLRISCEAVPPPVLPAGAQGGALACHTGAALSFVSCIRLLGDAEHLTP